MALHAASPPPAHHRAGGGETSLLERQAGVDGTTGQSGDLNRPGERAVAWVGTGSYVASDADDDSGLQFADDGRTHDVGSPSFRRGAQVEGRARWNEQAAVTVALDRAPGVQRNRLSENRHRVLNLHERGEVPVVAELHERSAQQGMHEATGRLGGLDGGLDSQHQDRVNLHPRSGVVVGPAQVGVGPKAGTGAIDLVEDLLRQSAGGGQSVGLADGQGDVGAPGLPTRGPGWASCHGVIVPLSARSVGPDRVPVVSSEPAAVAIDEVLDEALTSAVAALGGRRRAGQVAMAQAVRTAMAAKEHLLVQAGTGTGKSLAYLVPALLHKGRVVVATATLALQHQLVERDLPRLVEALSEAREADAARGAEDAHEAGHEAVVDTSYAVLKGRSNYACLHRIREGVPDDQGALVALPTGSLGDQVVALRRWAEQEVESGGTGEKDNAPRHTDRVWRQVSVNHRECLGASKCPFGIECFAERAREKAHQSHLIVTNHSLLAIDAIEGVPMIPDYDVVVIDEAHELTARVTQAATDELASADVERASRRAQRFVEGDEADALGDAADALADAIAAAPAGRFDALPEQLADALALVRTSARACVSAFGKDDSDPDAARTQAKGMAQEIFVTAERMAADSASDVVWLTEPGERSPARLHVAPLQVWGPMRDKLLSDKTVVFTSATLTLGGDFSAVATSVGLKPAELVSGAVSADQAPRDGDHIPWRALDVGSPFDYGKQAICYVARHLPAPGRDGLGERQLTEIIELVDAAEGRTLGLFSSRRAAETAAAAVREALPHLTTLAQGDAQLPELAAQFVGDPHTSLFGTLSLWQGLDVPGATCQLVIIDRIPFPRPDDPLMSARQRAADAAGGNGFMQVAATHAALLLAQGTGRLIRTTDDRGVVAILDPRLVTARYGAFLRASLPPMWTTTDPALVRKALRRLADA